MSQVFDALQRFESERSGIALTTLSTAFDVLEAAERNASAKPEALARIAPSERKANPERESFAIGGKIPLTPNRAEAVLISRDSYGEDNPELGFFRRVDATIASEARLICVTAPESLAAEKFRYLAVRLQEIRATRKLKTVLITSTIPQEGKSMVSANLACTLAATTQEKVLLLDSDLRRSSIAGMFGVAGIAGLSECLQGMRTLRDSIVRLEEPNLWLLAAGAGSTSPLQLLQSGGLSEIMEKIAGWFDWIIIDSSPAVPMADTSIWMRLVDGTVLVARPGVTESKQLSSFLDAVDPKKLVGAVLNCSSRPTQDAYYYKASSTSV